MHDRLDRIARDSYAKLLAVLASSNRGDIQAAEDALADAMATAVRTWPRDGEPNNPEAWLLKVARHRLIDGVRQQQRLQRSFDRGLLHELVADPSIPMHDGSMDEPETIPDQRLHMMFACAHPASDPLVRTPLLLQVVLGLSAERIASAFLVSPQTMSQRLVRGKTKIRDAGISFCVPERLDERVQTVLDAIYAAFAIGWDGHEPASVELIADAISLVRVVVEFFPASAEAAGLLSLMLYCDARQPARRTSVLEYVPLDEQVPSLWDGGLIDEADKNLRHASTLCQPGRYQLEAAIQAAHMERRRTGQTPWRTIVNLYGALLTFAPTIGVRIARAAALAGSGDVQTALDALDDLGVDAVGEHQPYWAVRAEILRRLHRRECIEAYDRAIGLCSDAAVRAYLQKRKVACKALSNDWRIANR